MQLKPSFIFSLAAFAVIISQTYLAPVAFAGGVESPDSGMKDAYIGLTASFKVKSYQPKWSFHFDLKSLLDPSKSGSMVVTPGAGIEKEGRMRFPMFYRVAPGSYQVAGTHVIFAPTVVEGRKYPEAKLPLALDSYLPILNLKAGEFVYFGEVEINASEEVEPGKTTKHNKLSALLSNGPLDEKVFAPYANTLAKTRWYFLTKGAAKGWVMTR